MCYRVVRAVTIPTASLVSYAIPLSVLRAVVAHCRRRYRAVLGLIEATFPVRVALGRHPFLHLR